MLHPAPIKTILFTVNRFCTSKHLSLALQMKIQGVHKGSHPADLILVHTDGRYSNITQFSIQKRELRLLVPLSDIS